MVIFSFIFGLFLGSFLKVLVDRLPRGESVIGGRSYCESCKKKLTWYDLIPLFSFIFLKGKCRYCHTSLSLFYPIVELTTGVAFVAAFLFVNQESSIYEVLSIKYIGEILYYLLVASSLIVIFFTDLKFGIIPDKIVFPAILISFLYLFMIHDSSFMIHILSAIGASLFFLFLFFVTRGRGMGFGDVKFAFLMGLVLGFPNIILALYVAFLTGAIVGCILIAWKKKRIRGTTLPFGPFLVIGIFLALFLGEKIMPQIILLLGLEGLP